MISPPARCGRPSSPRPAPPPRSRPTAATLAVTAGGATYTFNKASGSWPAIDRGIRPYRSAPDARGRDATLTSFAGAQHGNDYVITAVFRQHAAGAVAGDGNGWLGLTYRYALVGAYDSYGVTSTIPKRRCAASTGWGAARTACGRTACTGRRTTCGSATRTTPSRASVGLPGVQGLLRGRTGRGCRRRGLDPVRGRSPEISLRLYTPANGVARRRRSPCSPPRYLVPARHLPDRRQVPRRICSRSPGAATHAQRRVRGDDLHPRRRPSTRLAGPMVLCRMRLAGQLTAARRAGRRWSGGCRRC